MEKNMGTADRIFRIVVAVILAVLFFTGAVEGIPGTILLILAVVFLLTGIVGTCALYSLMGSNSLLKKKEEE
jgi:ABC-type multidrug transport system permease subunit